VESRARVLPLAQRQRRPRPSVVHEYLRIEAYRRALVGEAPTYEEGVMPDILHRVRVAAPPDKVCAAFTTTGGLSHWWVRDTKGDAGPGGTIDFG